MFFSYHISLVEAVLLSVGAAAAVVAVGYATLRSLSIARTRRFCDEAEARENAVLEPVSVIVYSQDEADALEMLLRDIIGQEYPAPMEVIVVNEGENSEVRDVVETLRIGYPGIYLTHTPDGARNLSRKKLALTLGIKAARYDTVVLTCVGAQIRSPRWLQGMMRHFGKDTPVEVVIGFAAQMADDDIGRGSRCRAFDTAFGAARWLGAAIAGHPFRASEYNLAYRREAFFRNKGFSRSLNLHFGDDDIFISEIAHGANTAVELGEESIVGLLAHDYSYALKRAGMRHVFTESHIRRRPRLWATLAALGTPVSLACCVSALIMNPYNGFVVALASAVLLLLIAGVTAGWRRLLRALDLRVLGGSIFPLAVGYPARRLLLRLRARFSRQKRYTWD